MSTETTGLLSVTSFLLGIFLVWAAYHVLHNLLIFLSFPTSYTLKNILVIFFFYSIKVSASGWVTTVPFLLENNLLKFIQLK